MVEVCRASNSSCVKGGEDPTQVGALSRVPFFSPVLARLLFMCFLHSFRVRAGTSAAISTQSLSPCVCIAPFSLLSSSSVQLPLRPGTRSMLGSKTSCDLVLQCLHVRPGTIAVIAIHWRKRSGVALTNNLD
jgi:hypothetical protein